MASGDKPYRVYRGGRTKGRVPTLPPPDGAARDGRRNGGAPQPGPARRRGLSTGRKISLLIGLLVLLLVAWAVASVLAVDDGVRAANERLDAEARAALTPQEGLLLAKPSVTALFGTDHSATIEARQGARRSDSIMLVRMDPARNRMMFLSVPRDLRVEIPGHGSGRINSAFQLGGAALALRTLRSFTGIPVNHVAVVDFGDFVQLIDALGGVTVTVDRPIVSNRFDCPYATQEQCRRWEGWRFGRGEQTMDGRRALIYSRIRENRLDPSESDLTRGARQQDVIQAIGSRVTSPRTLVRLPFVGDDLAAPLATDLSTWQFVQLGWRRFRANDSAALHCRLGGEPSSIGGEQVLLPTEENRNVIAMFVGAAAPQPPPPGTGVFGPGCTVGRRVAR